MLGRRPADEEEDAGIESFVIAFPAAFLYFGQEWAGYLSVLPSVAMTELLVTADTFSVKSVLPFVWIGLAAVLTVFVYRNWIKRSGSRN